MPPQPNQGHTAHTVDPAVTEPTNTPASTSRRQQILDTAAAVFAEKGIASTTVRDISDQVGIYSGSLYHHFKSKDEIVAGILEPIVASQAATLERIIAETDDPVEILSQGVVAAVTQTAAHPDARGSCNRTGPNSATTEAWTISSSNDAPCGTPSRRSSPTASPAGTSDPTSTRRSPR